MTQNVLDKKLERLAFEYFSSLDYDQSLLDFNIKELKICVERGYNTRAELISLIKKAMA
jgi:hypothetical protein